jgi:hypothetical protein
MSLLPDITELDVLELGAGIGYKCRCIESLTSLLSTSLETPNGESPSSRPQTFVTVKIALLV